MDNNSVKLSCRNLWKVYSTQSAPFGRDDAVFSGAREEVRKRLGEKGHIPAVMDANFSVRTGEIFVIMGLSGSGKSTLVRCLSRLIEPTTGEVLLDGEDLLSAGPQRLIELRRKSMGMVFQHFGLLPHLTVLDNVAFPLRVQGQPVKERHERAREMVELVGLAGRENAFPHELSGGQQQRVGIARSLAVGPGLWFLDEPFSALDPLIRRQMQDEFLRLQKKLHKTIVFITHDIQEAFRLADRIAVMRQGEIIQLGKPTEILLNPADDYVAKFVEDISLVRQVCAADLMSKSAIAADAKAASVSREATVEDLLAHLARGATGFNVTDKDAVCGCVDAKSVIAVLDRDRERRR